MNNKHYLGHAVLSQKRFTAASERQYRLGSGYKKEEEMFDALMTIVICCKMCANISDERVYKQGEIAEYISLII